jgi:hypothetical protein
VTNEGEFFFMSRPTGNTAFRYLLLWWWIEFEEQTWRQKM